mmetsp:Transcript_107587/g.304145  ORF Transcript_107587/g.304145 Transcript_107587/m.304145 type:complete len:82 (+) Transcript_107587:416-661(+)
MAGGAVVAGTAAGRITALASVLVGRGSAGTGAVTAAVVLAGSAFASAGGMPQLIAHVVHTEQTGQWSSTLAWAIWQALMSP